MRERERERERADSGTESGHIDETNYNTTLARLLKDRLPGWKRISPQAVRTTLDAGGDKKPDVLAVAPDDVPVVVEAKYAIGNNPHIVSAQAADHIGRSWGGARIEQSVAVLYPEALSRIGDDDYAAALTGAQLKFAGWRTTSGDPARFPEEGWLQGGLDDLSDFIETAADSEQRSADLVTTFSG